MVSHTNLSTTAPKPNPTETKIHKNGEIKRKINVVVHKKCPPNRFLGLLSLEIIPIKTPTEYRKSNPIIVKTTAEIPV